MSAEARTPRESCLEYLKLVVTACRENGTSPSYKHLLTIQDKLLEETILPRLRVYQILNKLAVARDTNTNVNLTIDEVNVILQAAREFK